MGFIRNINAWKTKTESMKARIKSSATSYVQRQVFVVLKEAVRVSPQYSGDYAFNWVIEVKGAQGAYDHRYKKNPWFTETPRQQGDLEIIAAVMKYAEDVRPLIKWNSIVSLKNYSPTAEIIESGKVHLRRVNLVEAPEGVIAYLNTKFKYLGKL